MSKKSPNERYSVSTMYHIRQVKYSLQKLTDIYIQKSKLLAENPENTKLQSIVADLAQTLEHHGINIKNISKTKCR